MKKLHASSGHNYDTKTPGDLNIEEKLGGICMIHIVGFEDAGWKVHLLSEPLHHMKGKAVLHLPYSKQLASKMCKIHKFSPLPYFLTIKEPQGSNSI